MDENNPMAVPALRRDLNDKSPIQIRDRIRGLIRVRALVRNKKNWRRHPQAQADALRGLLAEIGYADVIIARQLSNGKYEIIDGHLRAEITPDAMVPVIVLDVTEEEADKLLLTLDPLAAMAESDTERMVELLKTVRTDNEAVLELLRRTAGNRVWEIVHPQHLDEADISPDLADELMEKWETQPGQLWRIGPHRPICGDSTAKTVVRRLFKNATPARFRILTCDPAYGVSYFEKNEFLNVLDRRKPSSKADC
jgi:hypothetical protein